MDHEFTDELWPYRWAKERATAVGGSAVRGQEARHKFAARQEGALRRARHAIGDTSKDMVCFDSDRPRPYRDFGGLRVVGDNGELRLPGSLSILANQVVPETGELPQDA